jgi:hypothetical protein
VITTCGVRLPPMGPPATYPRLLTLSLEGSDLLAPFP